MGDYHGNRNTSRPIPKDAPEHVKNSTLDPEDQEHDKSGIKKLIDKIKH